jgi:Cu(I)/Ag(I) efflux system membrane protein CusA/SilA
MTIVTMAAALLPLLWAKGAGAEIMRRVAAPMIGGLITSAFLTLEVIPVLYTIWRTRQLAAARGAVRALEVADDAIALQSNGAHQIAGRRSGPKALDL